MGLRLNRQNDRDRKIVPLPARNKEYDGVKQDGKTVNLYGREKEDLSLELFQEENGKHEDADYDKVELTIHRDVNPWDRPVEDVLDKTKSFSRAIDHRTQKQKVSEEQHPVLLISFVLMITACCAGIVVLAWIHMLEAIDLYYNLRNAGRMGLIILALMWLDVILVTALFKKSGPLVGTLVLFPFAYPLKRGYHTNGHSVTGWFVCIVGVVAVISAFVSFCMGMRQYGSAFFEPNERIRHEVGMALDTEIDQRTFGNYIQKLMDIEYYSYDNADRKEYVQIGGTTYFTFRDGAYVRTEGEPVETTFLMKKNKDYRYELYSVTLGTTQLKGKDLSLYWDEVVK